MLKFKCCIVGIAVFTFFHVTNGWAGEQTFVPWNFNVRPVSGSASTSMEESAMPSLPVQVALAGLRFFSECISKVDGDRCPMYPTCAAYSRQAFKKHGVLIGYVMTADRLIHESNEMDYAPTVRVYERMRYYDPVSWNDYWWYHPEGLDK